MEWPKGLPAVEFLRVLLSHHVESMRDGCILWEEGMKGHVSCVLGNAWWQKRDISRKYKENNVDFPRAVI